MLYPNEEPTPGAITIKRAFLWFPLFHDGYVYWLNEYIITFYAVKDYKYPENGDVIRRLKWEIASIQES